MKVTGPTGVTGAAAPRGAARPVADGFALPSAAAAPEAAPASIVSAASSVSSLDALLALQEVGGPLERRRKAVRRAGRILDVLDDVKLALLEGGLPPAALTRLLAAVREERPGADDPAWKACSTRSRPARPSNWPSSKWLKRPPDAGLPARLWTPHPGWLKLRRHTWGAGR